MTGYKWSPKRIRDMKDFVPPNGSGDDGNAIRYSFAGDNYVVNIGDSGGGGDITALSGLPTSDTGLSADQIWKNGEFVGIGSFPVLPAFGVELIPDPSLPNLDGWTVGDGWSWDNGAKHTDGSSDGLTITVTMEANTIYRLTATISNQTQGFVDIYVNGTSIEIYHNHNGTFFTEAISSDAGDYDVSIYPDSNFDGTITSVSLKSLVLTTPAVTIRGYPLITDLRNSPDGLPVGALWNSYGIPRIVDDLLNGGPTGVLAVPNGSLQAFQVTWSNTSTNENGFKFEASTDGSYWEELKQVELQDANGINSQSVSSYPEVAGLYPAVSLNPSYQYWRVTSFRHNAFDEYQYSEPATFSGPIDFSALPGPQNLAVSVDEQRVTLTWDAWDQGYWPNGIILYVSDDGGSTWNILTAKVFGETEFVFLTPVGSYQYKARFSDVDTVQYSNTVSATTTTSSAADAPTGFTRTVMCATAIKLNWTHGGSHVDSYQLAYGTGFQAGVADASATEFLDENVTASTSYTYSIRAIYQGQLSSWVTVAAATTPAFDSQTPWNIPTSPAGLQPGMRYRQGNQVMIV